jgi:hypothetical protein
MFLREPEGRLTAAKCLDYEDVGEASLKGVLEPVHLAHVRLD